MTDGHGNHTQISTLQLSDMKIRITGLSIERRISLAGVIHLSDEYKSDGLWTGFTDVWAIKRTEYSGLSDLSWAADSKKGKSVPGCKTSLGITVCTKGNRT
jgi:hypothetical protein